VLGVPEKPPLALLTLSVIDDGAAGNRLRNVTPPPPATVRVPLKLLVHSIPRRPTSRTVPVTSNAELTVLLIGRRQVRVQVVNVAANESSWMNSTK
jgi:hypothetical protein